MDHDVFISYSTKDKQTADAICHVLEQNNLKCWIAPRNIRGGVNYADEIMDGLKNAKIVVLVFSKDSQESPYVNNEIYTAFINNKPIISFKIDETMPEKKLEFYLKNKHWLEAYPNPEDVFETLVNDALHLCEHQSPANIPKDFAIQNQKKEKDLVSFILLFTPFYSFSFIYMGAIVKKKLWLINGFVYLIPFICIILSMPSTTYLFGNIITVIVYLFFIFWFLALIHGLVIRKEFLTRKTIVNMQLKEDAMFDELLEEYSNSE